MAHRDNIERVLTAFEQGDWDEIHLVTGDTELHLVTSTALDGAVHLLDKSAPSATRTGGLASDVTPATPAVAPPSQAAPAAMATPAETGATATVTAAAAGPLTEVTAPSPGIFWRSPSPGAPPFAETGDRVEPATTMCIVEVMKLMNHVTAQVSGTVVDVLVGNGEQVDRGQPLFRIGAEEA